MPPEDPGRLQATFCATVVDEWVRAGVTDAVVCPGSRSTPLALALAAREELTLHVRLDERGAGFFALGLALATGRPPVVCVTSGTAAAELHPAVVESHHARVPLLVCTADRPPELHGVGAPQTIDQVGLYGGAVRWASDPGVPDAAMAGAWRSLGSRAVAEAVHGPLGPGTVHLNLRFRDPLVGEPGALPPGRSGSAPFHQVVAAAGAAAGATAVLGPEWTGRAGGRRGAIVAGAGAGDPELVLGLGAAIGWPVLADPRSGCRRADPHVVAAADALARTGAPWLRPEVVLRLGARWASSALASLCADADVVAVDPSWRWEDPERRMGVSYRSAADPWLAAAAATAVEPAPGGWLAGWQRAERAAQAAIDRELASGGLSEPAVARHLAGAVPSGAILVVASSMPVRDLEWYARARPDPPRVLANRGANGIDGIVSTALGAAAAAGGAPVVALLGDLAFFHDAGALVTTAGEETGSATFVVLDNDGGGIFSFLPQASTVEPGRFRRLFSTPQAADVAAVARATGARAVAVATLAELDDALRDAVGAPGITVVCARVGDPAENVACHERLHAAVAAALAPSG